MIYPLDADRIEKFASGLDTVVVVEDKASFMETQLREILFGHANVPCRPGQTRPEMAGPSSRADTELTAPRLERPLRQILGDRLTFPEAQPTATNLQLMLLPLARTACFCSGCPHNRSTVVPAGSLAGGGIGCHSMVTIEARPSVRSPRLHRWAVRVLEWIGQAPYTDIPHVFPKRRRWNVLPLRQLAVQACIAAGVNITYKILYNRAVAMPGEVVPSSVELRWRSGEHQAALT